MKIKKQITIDEEDIANLLDCIDRTKNTWEAFIDLWPFVIRHIIEEYAKQLTSEELEQLPQRIGNFNLTEFKQQYIERSQK